ncbi:hypothetical protein OHA98_36085 [Streptomyces sp. NBC_00654]|uniref:hypothetical protein n=1 Tax=Streptomyces sp. NBC_00654 TaxID=2975799 RepID=UPI00224FE1E2|nr:hypothetical protein [Streptomyces sp. NBC_00654]MCX4970083.1 hypothetical protein [Streptomyces sp. NBC_00654]
MTQSGQGDERQLPAVRPAHEGVVLPAEGGAPWTPGGDAGGPAEQAAPAGGQPWGQHWGPQSAQPPHPDAQAPGQQAQQGYPQAQPLPPAQPGPYQQPQQPQPQPQPQAGPQPHQLRPAQYQQPVPYQQVPEQQPPQQPGPYQPQPSQGRPQPYAQPLPPEAVPGTGIPGAGIPGGDADATQYIAPVPGGAGPVHGGPSAGGLPPERPAESTAYLGQVPQSGPAPQPGDSDATQYIPPVPGGAPYGIRPGAPGDRQPPAEFDNLFRSEAPAGATQQMPHVDATRQHQPPQHQQYQGQQHQQPQGGQLPPQAGQQPYQPAPQAFPGAAGPHEPSRGRGDGPAPRKRSAAIPLIAAVVVGCAVIGLGAGALMSGGDDDKKDDKQPVAAGSSPVAEPSTQAADPAKSQAEALDKLLADSNNSRSTVIGAVEKIKSCQALDQAATDLKGAAQQRRDLVTRLQGLTVDKLPNHAALTASLTRAWEASASADDHYAAWAGQAKNNKKVCKGGKARSTNETVKATERSSVASKAKVQASGQWNSIAEKYGLTKHAPTQL